MCTATILSGCGWELTEGWPPDGDGDAGTRRGCVPTATSRVVFRLSLESPPYTSSLERLRLWDTPLNLHSEYTINDLLV